MTRRLNFSVPQPSGRTRGSSSEHRSAATGLLGGSAVLAGAPRSCARTITVAAALLAASGCAADAPTAPRASSAAPTAALAAVPPTAAHLAVASALDDVLARLTPALTAGAGTAGATDQHQASDSLVAALHRLHATLGASNGPASEGPVESRAAQRTHDVALAQAHRALERLEAAATGAGEAAELAAVRLVLDQAAAPAR